LPKSRPQAQERWRLFGFISTRYAGGLQALRAQKEKRLVVELLVKPAIH
jgi:hypothetical protein